MGSSKRYVKKFRLNKVKIKIKNKKYESIKKVKGKNTHSYDKYIRSFSYLLSAGLHMLEKQSFQ